MTSSRRCAAVWAAIERLAAAHSGHRLAVFTDGGVIGQALALASGSRPFAFLSADNGSISRLVVTGSTGSFAVSMTPPIWTGSGRQ